MDNLVAQYCPWTIIGANEAVLYLFKSFKRLKNRDETLTTFFPLGQSIYADFEEIIRNQVSIGPVYTALKDWESTGLTFSDFMDEEQKTLLSNFWDALEENPEALSHRMVDLWNALPLVFTDYEKSLKADGYCTSAMAYAEVASLKKPIEDIENIIFAGFGQLSKADQSIISSFLNKGVGRMVWDFHSGYSKNQNHEVTRLIQRLKRNPDLADSIEKASKTEPNPTKAEVEIVGCVGQTGICQWIAQLAQTMDPIQPIGLIVLDPSLLPNLLENAGIEPFPFNISMGFGLSFTYEAMEIIQVLESWQGYQEGITRSFESFLKQRPWLQLNEENRSVQPIEWMKPKSPTEGIKNLLLWLQDIQPLIPKLPYEQQVWHQILEAFVELDRLLKLAGESELEPEFVTRLAKQIISSKSIGMEGNPNIGIQVMGLYESRVMDFDHVIFAPATDALLPASSKSKSLIPETIRKAFGLLNRSQLTEDEMYQAWRLTHRAKKISILVDESSDGSPSRLVTQIKYSGQFPVTEVKQHFGSTMPLPHLNPIRKSREILDKLNLYLLPTGNSQQKKFSPSSLFSILQCDLKFYFSHLLKLKAPDGEANLGMDVLDFGKWVHESIQKTIEISQGKADTLNQLKLETFQTVWEDIHSSTWNQLPDKTETGNLSDYPIETEVGRLMSNRFFQTIPGEKTIEWKANELELKGAQLERESNPAQAWTIEGRADMIMNFGGVTCLVDLKTGQFSDNTTYTINPARLEGLKTKLLKNKDLFQMVMYNWMVWKNRQIGEQNDFQNTVRAKLYYLANPVSSFVDPFSKVENGSPVYEELEAILNEALEKLMDENQDFVRTDELSYCAYCEYAPICQR